MHCGDILAMFCVCWVYIGKLKLDNRTDIQFALMSLRSQKYIVNEVSSWTEQKLQLQVFLLTNSL